MSGKTLEVRLIAQDGMSAVFAKAGGSAKTLGAAIKQAAADASSGAKTLGSIFTGLGQGMAEELEAQIRSTTNFATGLRTVRDAGIATGAMYRDHANDIKTLQAEYGAATDDIVRFADAMQDSTNFSNDQVIDAAKALGVLKDQAGLTTEQVQTLIARAADLDAAIGGGITQNATIMAQSIMNATDAAAAYNDVLAQTAFAQGLAAQQAEGAYGELSHLKNEFQDLAIRAGDALGPLGDFGAFIADYPTDVAVAVTATNQLAGALMALNSIKFGGAGVVAGVGLPVLGVAAFGAALYGAMELAWPDDEQAYEMEKKANTLSKQVDVALQVIQTSGERTATSVGTNTQRILSDSATAIDQIDLLNSRITSNQLALNVLSSDDPQYQQRSTQLKQDQADLALLTAQYGQWTGGTENQIKAEQGLLSALTYTGQGRALALKDIQAINERFAAGEITFDEWATGLQLVGAQLSAYDVIAARTGQTTEALAKKVGAAGDAMTYQLGEATKLNEYFTNEIAKAQDTLATQFERTRKEYTGTAEALATGFRVWIQNTDAIASQSQAVADWAKEMIKARGEWSRLDELVQKGLISGQVGGFEENTDYGRAQRAYDSIMGSNQNIQDYIDAIQVKAAPALAQLEAEQERQLATVLKSEPAQQALALAYMDSATAADALRLAQGYFQDPELYGPAIEQAAKYDQNLGLLLEDMGVIKRGAQGEIELAGVDSSQDKLDRLTGAIAALTQAQWIATFGGNPDAAEAAYERVMGDATAWDQLTAIASFDGDNAGALNAIEEANTAGNNMPDQTINIDGDASGYFASIPVLGQVLGTNYIDIVTRNITESVGGWFGSRHGGIPGYAHGGVVTELAEAGRERLHFANGGTAMVYDRGVYAVPPGTYVSPNNAVGNGGEPVIHIDFSGATFNNTSREEMDRWAIEHLAPTLQRVITDARRGLAS